MIKENIIPDNQIADALLNQSLQKCDNKIGGIVTKKPKPTECRVNLEAVALEQENFG
jgi:hypothetical protein